MPADTEDAVLGKINEAEVVKFTREIAKVAAHTGFEADLANTFADKLRALGFSTQILEVSKGRPNVIARLKGDGTGYSVLFNGHLDGGRENQLPGWTKDPFGGELSDGKIYGAGLRDMKGGDVAMLMALNAIKEAGIGLKGDIILTLTIGHSEHGLGVEELVQNKVVADMAIIGEPTNMNVCITHRAWVDMELVTRGLPTGYHTTTAHRGVNAIQKMSKILLAMEQVSWKRPKVPAEVEKLYPDASCYWNVGLIEGGFEGGGYPSMVPNYCKAGLNVRPMYGMDYNYMVKVLNDAIKKVRAKDPKVDATLKYSPGFPLDYLYIPSNSPLVKVGRESIRRATGRKPKLVKYNWTTDGGILQKRAKMPTVVWGPCEVLTPPIGADEYITINELVGATRSFALAATKISGRTKSEYDEIYS